jgi:hypothetical protein
MRLTLLLVTSLLATLSLGMSNLGLGASSRTFPTYAIGKNGFVFENLPEIGRWEEQRAVIASKLDEQIEIIRAINNALKKRNIKLVVTLIPMVHTIYEAQLPNGFVLPEYAREIYGLVQRRFNQIGIETPDLETAFMRHPSRKTLVDPLFMRTDHHWSPSGGLQAAQVMAQYLQNKHSGLLAGIPEVKYSMKFAEAKTFPQYSSLYRQLPASEQAKVKLDLIRIPEFSLVEGTASNDLGLGLLTDTTPRITVVGSSFSDIEAFGFVAGLSQRLSKDVLNAAHGGMGSFAPLIEYLSSDAYQNNPPTILVWETAIKMMVFGMQPIHNSDDWAARQYLLELAANLPGACQNGLAGRVASSHGFHIQGATASIASSGKKSLVRYEFATPIKSDHYLSLNVNSSTSDSFVIEGEGRKPVRYFVKLGDYNATHGVNVPLATLSNGKSTGLTIRFSPGSQVRLEGPMLCTAAPDLMRLAGNRQ